VVIEMRARLQTSLLAVVLFILLMGLFGGLALAHAEFSGGEPAPGASLSESPDRVRLTFSETVAAEFDPVQVTGPGGERVDRQDARVAPDDANTVEVRLEELSAGAYTVEYRVTSVDGHVISGSYEFAVAPPAEETTGKPTEETTAEPTEEPSMEPTRATLPETENTGGAPSPFGTYAVVGLVVIGLAALTVAVLRARGGS
jgi:methionine-rich copper-binding protein CopC